jgi:glycosyltransferase involved in cell wall biosynthesis
MKKFKINKNIKIENKKLCLVKTIIILILITFLVKINIIIKFNFLIKRPKISIILPIYNKEKYLHRSIGSILGQTFKDIEIVLVNDGSTDNSLNIIQNYSKKDSRMKIVNNDKNRGLFYSRGNGILNSIGDYLMFLEPDDLLKGNNNLEYLYNETKDRKEDIIIYPYYNVNRKQNRFKCRILNKTVYQPEIFNLAFNRDNNIADEVIWNKLIKREIFIEVAKTLEKFMIRERWNHHEDTVWSLLSHKYAQSMECIDKVIYIYEKIMNL